MPIENNLKYKDMSDFPIWKHLVLFIIGLVGLLCAEISVELIVEISAGSIYGAGSDAYEEFVDSATYAMLINGISYTILFIAFALFLKKDVRELTKSFRGYRPFVAGLIGLAVIYALSYNYGVILGLLKTEIGDNDNEATLNSAVLAFPVLSLIIFGNIGPVCEELTYRVGLFSLLRKKNRYLAYIVEVLVFAFIHFGFTSIGTKNFVNEILNMPFYIFSGLVFTYLYERYGLAASLTAHILNNTMSVAVTILGNR